MATLIKQPSECRVLIVDDEATFCDLLCAALESRYRVTPCHSGREAVALVEQNDFDVVVTDLRLQDISGIDVLRSAKTKDPYTEVMLITGFASLESASAAIDLGAISYIEKPLQLDDFIVRVEKAVASRLFYLKSLSLMRMSDGMSPEFKDHLSDITSLYYFTRKVTFSLEVAEIVRITLEEVIRKSRAPLCAIGLNAFGFREIYAMSAQGDVDAATAKTLFISHREAVFPFFEKEYFQEGSIATVIYKGKEGLPPPLDRVRPVAIPLVVTGTSIGTIAVFFAENESFVNGDLHFLNIISSIVSPLIEHGYSVQQVRQLAKTDALTGLANHRSFYETLDHEIARVNRKGSTFSLIFMDIDDFKQVNDTYGHLAGDAVLKDLANRVMENIRLVDAFFRYGGEEFALILPETGSKGAEVVAQRIKNAITSKPFLYGGKAISYTVSMGISLYDAKRPVKKHMLINDADAAMYRAKHDGKNRIALCTTDV
ncbi:MAG: diguanylate cyclase [Chitinispirillaceae bacterium]